MISMVLSVVVMTSSGGLLSERTPAVGMLVGAVDLNTAGAAYDTMSLEQLTAERVRWMEAMPSIGPGLVLTIVGGGVFLVGFSVFLGVSILVGVVMMIVAVPLLVIGPILLAGVSRERREAQTQVRLIDQRIAALRRDEVSPVRNDRPPPNDEAPPPPPMRPPGSELTPTVEPQLLLATF